MLKPKWSCGVIAMLVVHRSEVGVLRILSAIMHYCSIRGIVKY